MCDRGEFAFSSLYIEQLKEHPMFSTIQSDLIYFLTEYWRQAFAFATITGGLLLLCRWFYLMLDSNEGT